VSVLNEDERNQEGIHNPREKRPEAPERVKGCRRDNPPSSHHGRGRSEADDTLTMISHGVEISITGGRADEKDEGNKGAFLFFYFFYLFLFFIFISYICCKGTRNRMEH